MVIRIPHRALHFELKHYIHFLIRKCYRFGPDWWLWPVAVVLLLHYGLFNASHSSVAWPIHMHSIQRISNEKLKILASSLSLCICSSLSLNWIIALYINGDNDKWLNVINSKMIFTCHAMHVPIISVWTTAPIYNIWLGCIEMALPTFQLKSMKYSHQIGGLTHFHFDIFVYQSITSTVDNKDFNFPLFSFCNIFHHSPNFTTHVLLLAH